MNNDPSGMIFGGRPRLAVPRKAALDKRLLVIPVVLVAVVLFVSLLASGGGSSLGRDGWQKIAIRHIEQKYRGVQFSEVHSPERLTGAIVDVGQNTWISAGFYLSDDFQHSHDSAENSRRLAARDAFVKQAVEGGRAVRCEFSIDTGFGQKDFLDAVVLIDHQKKVRRAIPNYDFKLR